tara:strand:+ start:5677 stop:6456 length:780 start_codon:yes stop_codon:yes gene_type:complete
MAKLYHRKNEIAIDLSGIQNPAAIEFYYTGKMYAESQLPDDWFLMCNENRIICTCLGDSVPELILNYVGLINIRSGSVVDRDLNTHYLSVAVEDIDYWENMSVDFDKNTQYWEGLGSNHEGDSQIKHSSIVKNNLISGSDEFYFADGTPFQGDYHQHGDGQAMTGSEHSDNSELIYRKDAKGKMQDLRKNLNRNQLNKRIVHYKPIIPSVRKSTKSESQKAKDIKKQTEFSQKQRDTAPPKVEREIKVQRRTPRTTKGY